MSIRNNLLAEVLTAYGGAPSALDSRNMLLEKILTAIGGVPTNRNIMNALLADIVTQLGGAITNPNVRNSLLRDIVIAAGGVIANPNIRNLLINDWLQVAGVAVNLYVNPTFSGVATSWPIGNTDNPPTAHQWDFDTTDAELIGNEMFFNNADISGRRMNAYRLDLNNPGLFDGNIYEFSFKAATTKLDTTGDPALNELLGFAGNALSLATIVNNDSLITELGERIITLSFYLNEAVYTNLRLRAGVGYNGASGMQVSISEAKLSIIGVSPMQLTYSNEYSEEYP